MDQELKRDAMTSLHWILANLNPAASPLARVFHHHLSLLINDFQSHNDWVRFSQAHALAMYLASIYVTEQNQSLLPVLNHPLGRLVFSFDDKELFRQSAEAHLHQSFKQITAQDVGRVYRNGFERSYQLCGLLCALCPFFLLPAIIASNLSSNDISATLYMFMASAVAYFALSIITCACQTAHLQIKMSSLNSSVIASIGDGRDFVPVFYPFRNLDAFPRFFQFTSQNKRRLEAMLEQVDEEFPSLNAQV